MLRMYLSSGLEMPSRPLFSVRNLCSFRDCQLLEGTDEKSNLPCLWMLGCNQNSTQKSVKICRILLLIQRLCKGLHTLTTRMQHTVLSCVSHKLRMWTFCDWIIPVMWPINVYLSQSESSILGKSSDVNGDSLHTCCCTWPFLCLLLTTQCEFKWLD